MNKIELSGKLPKATLDLLEKLYKKFNNELKRKAFILSLAIVDEQEMTKLNKRFFNRNQPTDVLSFENSDEIIICLPIAKQQARQDKKKLIDELALLFVHGCLHIAGYDHNNVTNANKMSVLQKKILGRIPNRILEYK